MENQSNSVVYERSGVSEREANAMEDGGDEIRDEGRSVHRFEGKVIRKKRGLRDVNAADKSRKHLSKFKRISERDIAPEPAGDMRHGGHSNGKELSWKEIAERKQGRHRLLNGKNGDHEGDGSGRDSLARNEPLIKGGKSQSEYHFKGGLEGGGGKSFPAKRKPTSQFDVQNGDAKRKKLSEPVKKRRHRLILQDHSDDDDYYVRPLPVKKDPNPPETRAIEGKEADKETDPDVAAAAGNSGQHDQGGVRKSSRVPRRKVLDDFEGDVPDVAFQRSGRRKQSNGDGKSGSQDSDSNNENAAGASDRAFSESEADAEDWNDGMDLSSKSKQSKKISDLKAKSAPLTARQRSLQLANVEGDANGGLNLIEFPDGLAQFSRRGTTKLSLEDRQAKKAEAASRRKQVVEKAAKEQQATAIQKILGQDSTRRKKEERLQKQREEIKQEKKAAALEAPSNSVRWTLGPRGTTVSWSEDAKLPDIFSASVNPSPPQRCAAPSCTNLPGLVST